ncbi:hypothetical protein [Brevundimonas nasdae]|uniref:Uncharacterized protein n=1 Tax=Brevundimonas nasdae TaxID=172043 RepID=A0ABX8TLF9_9CAUL|nr:hypothetical protein [Brevundimonas nasdae]QYC11200.1 hypothetical protein KWG56_04115 [Brevundimonas nasdae]
MGTPAFRMIVKRLDAISPGSSDRLVLTGALGRLISAVRGRPVIVTRVA